MFETKSKRPFQLRSFEKGLTPGAAGCESCLYWELTDEDTGKGICRRHAPTKTGWPASMDEDWCGEWVHCPIDGLDAE